jgi:hypothetical protein
MAMPAAELEYLVFAPNAPLIPVYLNTNAWGEDRCPRTGAEMYKIPFPTDWFIASSNHNAGTSILMPGGKIIFQFQPAAKCVGNNFATGTYPKTQTLFNEDIRYGLGITGAHGGSNLSTLGGTIRLGELRPGAPPMRHALKMSFGSRHQYGMCVDNKAACFTWPAQHADWYAANATNGYGVETRNTHPYMKMGALLAIPPSVNINNMGLLTEPGKMIAWTLQNYGAYIVDSNSVPTVIISVEESPSGTKREEFIKDYGHTFESRLGYSLKVDESGNLTHQAKWTRDIRLIIQSLHVVYNNGPNTVGGGGTPRQPLAPANFSR